MKESKYKLESLNIRAAENGYILRCEKRLTEKARAKQRIADSKKSEPIVMDGYKSKEQVADSLEEVLAIVKNQLSKNDANMEFDDAFDEDDG